MDISPTTINAIGTPLKPFGMLLDNSKRSLIVENIKIINKKPAEIPNALTIASPKLRLRSMFISTAPSMAQFEAINGKNIPRDLYKEGINFLISISTNWTKEALTSINTIVRINCKLKGDKIRW